MGFDTSFHAVDLALIEDRLLPFIAGEGSEHDLDDLLDRAVSLRRVRFRAKSWAMGACNVAKAHRIEDIDPWMLVWGRPFFVVAENPEQAAEGVMRWIATPLEDADGLAREMAGRAVPGLVETVEPDTDGHLASDEAMRADFLRLLLLLRASMEAARRGKMVVDHGEQRDPLAILARDVPFSVLQLAAHLTPGWMSRGSTWPTQLYASAGIVPATFHAPDLLYERLRDRLPQLEWFAPPTIVENYMVGALVDPADLAAARADLANRRGELLGPPRAEGWGVECARELTKIEEAMALASRLGFGFCEATEIYSGMAGNLN